MNDVEYILRYYRKDRQYVEEFYDTKIAAVRAGEAVQRGGDHDGTGIFVDINTYSEDSSEDGYDFIWIDKK